MQEFVTREFEISTLAFFIQRPLYYAARRKDLRNLKLDKKMARIFKIMDDTFTRHHDFPALNEMREVLKESLQDQNHLIDVTWPEYEQAITEIYSTPVSSLTGDLIQKRLASQMRDDLVEKLQTCPIDNLGKLSNTLESDLFAFRRASSGYEDRDIGFDFFGNLATVSTRAVEYNTSEVLRTIIWPTFDKGMNGGARKGELNGILATTGGGKTFMLMNLARAYVENGYRGAWIYLDSLETEISKRFSECLLNTEIKDTYTAEWIENELRAHFPHHQDKLFQKQFPAKSISPDSIDEYITDLKMYLYIKDKEAGVPEEDCGKLDYLILDYFDLLRYDGKEEGFVVEKAKAEQLNGIAIKHNIVIWTGTQGGTEGMKTEKMKLYMAHGYKDRFHPFACVCMISIPEASTYSKMRQIDIDFGKMRRPPEYASIPFIQDTQTQRMFEDGTRQPKTTCSKANSPDQTEYALTGRPSQVSVSSVASAVV